MSERELRKFFEYLIDEKIVFEVYDVESFDEYIYQNFIHSQPQNESPNIRQNEEQVRNCSTCKYVDGIKCNHPCGCEWPYEYWEAIPIVPAEWHSA